jgi:hypothetical protein
VTRWSLSGLDLGEDVFTLEDLSFDEGAGDQK